MVVVAVEIDPVTAPQFAHQPHRLAQPRETLLELRPFAGVAGGDLVERLTGAHAQEDAPGVPRHAIVAKACATTAGYYRNVGVSTGCPAPAAWCARRPRSSTPRTARARPRGAPRLEVVADRGAVHAVRLGGHRQFDEFARRELFADAL